MRVHGLEIAPSQWAALRAHLEATYPEEGCAIGLGRPGAPRLDRVLPIPNVAPTDRRRTFRLDDRARLAALMVAPGLVERLVAHTHCDGPAYWSAADAAGALADGEPRLPGAIHLVVSVVAGRCAGAAAVRWDAASARFVEEPADLPAPVGGSA